MTTTADNSEVYENWVGLKKLLDEVKEKEMTLRIQICEAHIQEHIDTTGIHRNELKQIGKTDSGYQIQVKIPKNDSVDLIILSQALSAKKLTVEEQAIFKYSATIKAKEFKELLDTPGYLIQNSTLQEVLTQKEGTMSLQIKKEGAMEAT